MIEARPDHLTWRHRVVAALLALAILGIVGRLVQLQVLDHERYVEQAAATRLGAVEVYAPRGAILDATGYPLAISVDAFDVYVDRFLWRDREKAQAAATRLAPLIHGDPAAILRAGSEQDSGDALVARQIAFADGDRLQREALFGVRLIPSSVRIYPEGDLAGQLVGYVGLDQVGLWGIEADYETVLHGKRGWLVSERDPLGRPIAFGPRRERAPTVGGEVQLTVDRFVQAAVERRLDEALKQFKAPSGSIIVMDPRTGAVLAMASRPAVSLSRVNLDDPALSDLVRNRAVTDLYEPGSVLKTITTAAALDLGKVTPETTYRDSGQVKVLNDTIRNWDLRAYGEVTVREYLQYSLNTGAVWLSDLVGAHEFYRYLRAFGLGEATHVGLAGEAEGQMRTPDDPDWYPVDLATNSYGQGIAASPLQVLAAVNAFANGGVLMRPYIVSRVVTGERVRQFQPVQVRRVVSPGTAETMRLLMRDVVEGVPAHGARVPGYEVAGKTGTTLVSIPTGYDLATTIATFAGFIPAERPVVSIVVKIDQPQGALNLGGEVAAPIFARVASDVMAYLNVPPTRPVPAPARVGAR